MRHGSKDLVAVHGKWQKGSIVMAVVSLLKEY